MFKRTEVISIGSAVIDYIFYTDQGVVIPNPGNVTCQELLGFERAAKIASDDVHISYGGGAANAAVTFARAGLKTEILTRVGIDAMGRDCILNLQQQGVGTKRVQHEHAHKTGFSFIINRRENHDHVIFVYRGASAKINLAKASLGSTPWIYLTALSGNWQKNLTLVFSHAARAKARIAWNPGGEQLAAGLKVIKKYLRQTHVLMVNQDEALELLVSEGQKITSQQGGALARRLHAYGSSVVIVTAGHKGAYAYDGKKVWYQSAIPVKRIINKTGAGDAFGSAVIAALIRRRTLQQALRAGAQNSHAVVGHVGAQAGILSRKDFIKILGK